MLIWSRNDEDWVALTTVTWSTVWYDMTERVLMEVTMIVRQSWLANMRLWDKKPMYLDREIFTLDCQKFLLSLNLKIRNSQIAVAICDQDNSILVLKNTYFGFDPIRWGRCQQEKVSAMGRCQNTKGPTLLYTGEQNDSELSSADPAADNAPNWYNNIYSLNNHK